MLHVFASSLPISPYPPEQTFSPVRKKRKKKRTKVVLIRSRSIPAVPKPLLPGIRREARQPGANPNPNPNLNAVQKLFAKDWRAFANGKWHREDESALSKSEPLPLPMTYPSSTPVPEDVEKMKNCDPEVKDCKEVLYQWTGNCSRCQGSGEVSYFRKKGREVICKCITCLGLGYVHKMTIRTDIEVVEELDDTS